jgi:hypothetical protein
VEAAETPREGWESKEADMAAGLFGPAWLPSNTWAYSNTRVPVGSRRDVDVDHRQPRIDLCVLACLLKL